MPEKLKEDENSNQVNINDKHVVTKEVINNEEKE